MKHAVLGLLVLAAFAAPGRAAFIIDGSREPAYGLFTATQSVQTGFGDNQNELNAAWLAIDQSNLYMVLTGNLEANFNKLEIFFDTKAGGQSIFDSAGNDNADRMDGLVFDAGFTADYHLIIRRGTDNGNTKVDLDFADVVAQAFTSYQDTLVGGGLEGSGATGIGVNASPILVAYDGSNIGGVTGGTGAANESDAINVTTGVELSIDLDDLGYAGGHFRIMAAINGSGHDFWSNQFLGHLQAPHGNLGGDGMGNFTGEGAIDMNDFELNQFFTIVPEPASCSLLMLALAALATSRRRFRTVASGADANKPR
jgi:hypothetical protein